MLIICFTRPLTLGFCRIVCPDLSTDWGLYFYRRCSSPRRVPRPMTSLIGAFDWNWTSDTGIFSPLLYLLSYKGIYIWRRESESNRWIAGLQPAALGLFAISPWSLPADLNCAFNGHNVACYHYTKAGIWMNKVGVAPTKGSCLFKR